MEILASRDRAQEQAAVAPAVEQQVETDAGQEKERGEPRHGPAGAMERVRRVQSHQVYCAARPMQLGAARALDEAGDWLTATRRLYVEAGRRTAEVLGLAPPEGGTFVFFDASPWLADDDADCLPFLERCIDAGVLLTPGAACGDHHARSVRLCFTVVPPDELDDALSRLAGVLGR